MCVNITNVSAVELSRESFNLYESDNTIDNFANPEISDAYIVFIEAHPEVNGLSLDVFVSTYYGNNIKNLVQFN